MKKLLVTAGLCAAIASSMIAVGTSPVSASPTLPLPPPGLSLPNISQLPLRPILSLPIGPFPLFRAELTAQLYTQPVGPNYPHLHWVICVVRNSGLIASGPFQTLITRVYAGTPSLPGPAIATPVTMNIPAHSQAVLIWTEYVTGPLQVGAYADYTHVVPEYNEANNTDSLIVHP